MAQEENEEQDVAPPLNNGRNVRHDGAGDTIEV
eukprot:CAMPEP_0116848328 /NCGR_PEP_ID=MMETSP0418-20121206/14935_1 /TAXON_ID=1158023 /ORGANISM="Astrosyne radiata, Strain 13vi08-1A" /LENGTH=32 /DNA_ID= /DNA_START= /DNA_END= /DNA_ORIENTATION=